MNKPIIGIVSKHYATYKSNKNNHAAELQGEVKKTKRKEVATV